MCLSFKEPIRDSTRAYVDHVPKRVARRGTSVMGVFWLKITYTFLTDRNAFFHPFYRSNYKYFTDYEFLPVIGFNAGDDDNNFLNIKRYAILGLKLHPKNEATTSTFY